jgi:hypothetical protein
LLQRHYAELIAGFADETDFLVCNFLVDLMSYVCDSGTPPSIFGFLARIKVNADAKASAILHRTDPYARYGLCRILTLFAFAAG